MNYDDSFINLLSQEIIFKAIRSRGPGGQNVNKVSSAAALYWSYYQSVLFSYEQKEMMRTKLANHINTNNFLFLRCDEFRDLERNKARCIEKLISLIKIALHKEKPRKATKPTYSSKVKKLESKSRRGEVKKHRKKVDW